MKKSKLISVYLISSLILTGCDFFLRPISPSGSSTNPSDSDTTTSVEDLETIDLKVKEVTLRINQTYKLSYDYGPKNAADPEVIWSSSDEDVATVSDGLVTALTSGVATIKVQSVEFPLVFDEATITVESDEGKAIKKAAPSYTYKDVNRSGNVENKGNQKVLVIPTYFSDDSANATEENRLFIKKSFFGTNEECKWRSFTGYYQEASYGQLNYSGIVADTWYAAQYDKQYVLDYDYSSQQIAAEALGWFKTTYSDVDLSEYDANNDGNIDSLYIIYASDYQVNGDNETTNLWGYRWTTYYQSNEGEGLQPRSFSWFSLKFLKNTSDYGGVPTNGSNTRIIIHEHGHMLGLPDYYDTTYLGDGIDYVGGFDMQSHNTFDWNAFSKYSMGWVNPYYVDEDVLKAKGSETITIGSLAETGDCLLIRNKNWNGCPFDEYILLELFNPYVGNNQYDYHFSTYAGIKNTGFGVKIYHVDARMYRSGAKVNSFDGSGNYRRADNNYHTSSQPMVIAGDNIYNFHFLHLLQKDGSNTFAKKDTNLKKYRHTWQQSDLWQTGNTFTLTAREGYKAYGNGFFYKQTTLNDGSEFPFGLTFNYVSPENATITISYLD